MSAKLAYLDRWIDQRDRALGAVIERARQTDAYTPGVADLISGYSGENSLAGLEAAIRRISGQEGGIFGVGEGEPQIVIRGRTAFIDGHPPTAAGQPQARLFGSRNAGKALLVVPHWNARIDAYVPLCTVCALAGFLVALVVPPFHGERRYDARLVANEYVSANLGRTVAAVRMTVQEVRQFARWLAAGSTRRVTAFGASLGSCIAGIAAAVEPAIRSAVLVVTGGDFAYAVWNGAATSHIREALEGRITFQQLQSAWNVLALNTYVPEFAASGIPMLVVSARQDRIVLPENASDFVGRVRLAGRNSIQHVTLRCGHYTAGTFPFNIFVIARLIGFIRREHP